MTDSPFSINAGTPTSGILDRMQATCLSSALVGALVALLASGGYLLFGPLGLFGEPEASWAQVVFYPGVWAAWRTFDWFHSPRWLYTTVGVATMVVCGAVLGLAFHALCSPTRRTPTS